MTTVIASASGDSDFGVSYLLGAMTASGGIGALIGTIKGRTRLGLVLGLTLGFIGWIIVGVMKRTPEKEAKDLEQVTGYREQVTVARSGTAPAVGSLPPGAVRWAPDPYGRHTHRLHDGHRWTEKVADNGEQSIDQPVFPTPSDVMEGWAPDPFGRSSSRYHRGGRWTEHIVRDGATGIDPPEWGPPILGPPSSVSS